MPLLTCVIIIQCILPNRDEEEEESGAGEASYSVTNKRFNIVHRFIHDGEVNRARAMHQNPDIIATKSPSPNVLIFDRTRHPSIPRSSVAQPDLILGGHSEEGFALSWSALKPAYLCSGSGDSLVCVWDVSAAQPMQRSSATTMASTTSSAAAATPLMPLLTLKAHATGVNDVNWSQQDEVRFAHDPISSRFHHSSSCLNHPEYSWIMQ